MSDQNEQLFIDAVKAKRQAMWRVAFHLLRSEADAEDAVSAAVESTWKHLPRMLLMKFDEEMQEKEIAAALHLPRGTVSSRITRGLEMIRKEMRKEEAEDASGRIEESASGRSADASCGL